MRNKIALISKLLLLLTACVLLWSCDSSTNTSKGIIKGIVLLDGETDHSGIVVSIYNAGIVPEELRLVQDQYPQLAFPVDDKVLFDHREYEALYTVYTDNEGNFSFPKLPYDEYIVTYSKEGWGYNYLFDIELNSDEINITDKISKLYAEIELPSYIEGQYVLNSGKCYVAKNDVVIGVSGLLIMEANSRLLIDQNVKISSHGLISTPDSEERAYITSYSGIYSGAMQSSNMGDGLYVYSGTNELANISFSYLLNALQISSDDFAIEFLSFNQCAFGLVARAMDDMSISKSLFINCNDTNAAACHAYDVQGLEASGNLFYSNYIAQKHEIVKNAVVEDNAFINNDRGYLNLWESTTDFRYNEVTSDGIAIENSGKSNLNITYNDIDSKVGVKTYYSYQSYNTVDNGWTKANHNNIIASQYAVESRAYYYYPDGPYPLDFANNWWGTTDISALDDLIIDYNDLGLEGGYGVTSIVNYNPIRTSQVNGAGIQTR
nr:hypothetical protein [Candidatus Cloacimonadota bacterium]